MASPPATPVYDSAQTGSNALLELREVIKYQNLIIQLVRRDILTRYKRSVLGIAWSMLTPLGTMIVLTIVFSHAFRSITPDYPAFVLSGLIAWLFFSQSTNAITLHLIWGGDLFRRIYIPRTTFAISAIGTGLINLVLSLIPLLLVIVVISRTIHWTVIFVPIAILFLAMFALGIGLLVATIAVYFADVAEMYQIVLTAWMYLTPILYPPDYLPPQYQIFLRLNPMYHMVQLFRSFVYYGQLPSASEFLLAGGIATVTLALGWWIFTKKADEFAYRI
jgi:ABC-2 type transport system permease protein